MLLKGEVFASATFFTGDGGMINCKADSSMEGGISILGLFIIVVLCDMATFPPLRMKSLMKRVLPSTILACYVLSDKVANMAPLESAMLKFSSSPSCPFESVNLAMCPLFTTLMVMPSEYGTALEFFSPFNSRMLLCGILQRNNNTVNVNHKTFCLTSY